MSSITPPGPQPFYLTRLAHVWQSIKHVETGALTLDCDGPISGYALSDATINLRSGILAKEMTETIEKYPPFTLDFPEA